MHVPKGKGVRGSNQKKRNMKIKVKDKNIRKNFEDMELALDIEFFEFNESDDNFFMAFVDNKTGLRWRSMRGVSEEVVAMMDDIDLFKIELDDTVLSFVPYEYNANDSAKKITELRTNVINKINQNQK